MFRRWQFITCAFGLYEPAESSTGGGGSGIVSEATPIEAPATIEEKRWTDAEVDRMVQARLAKDRKTRGIAPDVAELRAREAKLLAELEELRSQSQTSAPTADQSAELAKLQRENARLARERDELTTKSAEHEKRVSELTQKQRDSSIETALRRSLVANGASERTIDQAVRLFREEGSTEIDEDGTITVTIEKLPYSGDDQIAKAAKRWLDSNPHFQKAIPGGSNAARPNAGGHTSVPLTDLPVSKRISLGLGRG